MPKPLQNPEQELRFTRAAQAKPLLILAAVLATAAFTVIASAYYRDINTALPHPLWALVPLILAWLVARLAVRMTRHAYLILTPMGVEVFPLFRPQKHMRAIYWQEIASIDVTDHQVTLHFDEAQSSGVHLTLRPIPKPRRELLIHALEQRLADKK
ncbi:MAG: hypothetical protein R3242_10760 [Akkermansiaceae bacterium]|nr:hypothetical protein [Akkermansiaceae bacterium]